MHSKWLWKLKLIRKSFKITACTIGGLCFILEAGSAAPGALEQRPHPAYVVQDQNLFIDLLIRIRLKEVSLAGSSLTETETETQRFIANFARPSILLQPFKDTTPASTIVSSWKRNCLQRTQKMSHLWDILGAAPIARSVDCSSSYR
jgi:hypothetical protein